MGNSADEHKPVALTAEGRINELLERIRLLEAIAEATYCDFGPGHRFDDMLGRMNPLHWHYCNIHVRINGQERIYQGDWLKQVFIARERCRHS